MIAVLPAELFYSTSRETKSSSYFWGLRLKKGILEWHLFYSYSRDTDFKNTNFKLPQKLWDLLILFLEWRTGKQVFNSTMRNLLQLCIKLVLEGSFQKRLWKWAHWNYYKTEGFRQEKNLILYSALNLWHCSEYFHVLFVRSQYFVWSQVPVRDQIEAAVEDFWRSFKDVKKEDRVTAFNLLGFQITELCDGMKIQVLCWSGKDAVVFAYKK